MVFEGLMVTMQTKSSRGQKVGEEERYFDRFRDVNVM